MALLKKNKHDVKGATIAIQGFGNVGSFCGRFLHDAGCKVVSVSDVTGGIHDPKGLDIEKLQEHIAEDKPIKEFADGISNEELLALDVDVLIPAALGGVLTADNAKDVRAKFIVEAANNPTRPEADEIFQERGILVLPDILANAGGVTVSYFEWVQNRQYFRWELDRTRKELDKVMLDSFENVWEIAEKRQVTLRLAAYLLGIGRVGRATVLGGI